MSRYDIAKDVDLQVGVQRALEKQFFLNQYRKRKFITDKNVLFDENDSDDTKKEVTDVFDCNEMQHDDVYLLYQRASENIRKIDPVVISTGLPAYSDSDNLFWHLVSTQRIKQAIDGLQYYLAYNRFKLFQKDFVPNGDDFTRCETLLKTPEMALIMMKLTLISIRYGMFITDLCSFPYRINIKYSFDEEETSLCRAFSHYSDFNTTTNPHVLQEDESLHRKRLQGFQKGAQADKKISRLEAAAAKKALPNSVPGSFYSNSALKRRAGLWIWDNCDNIRKTLKMTKSEAIRKLIKKPIFEDRDDSSLIRELNRVYIVTKKCIESGEIMPIEDGKEKKSIPVSNMDP